MPDPASTDSSVTMKEGGIALRQVLPSDKARLAVLANNRKIWDNLRDYFPNPYTEEDAEIFIDISRSEIPPATFAITCEEQLVGVAGLVLRTDVYRKSAEIGYWIGEPYWGKGITPVAVKLLAGYGFNVLGLVRIDAGVFEYNKASCRVLEKCGFELEGVFRNACFKNNRLVNEKRYALIKSESI